MTNAQSIVIPTCWCGRRFPRKRSHGRKNGDIFWCSSHHDFRDLIQRRHWKETNCLLS